MTRPKGPVYVSTSGNFSKTSAYLNKLKRSRIQAILNSYGNQGVAALAAATPVESGLSAASWYFTTGVQDNRYWIDFHNTNIVAGTPVVILIQYGHGTRNGGYIPGKDFINPAIAPIFEAIKNGVWKEVSKA